MKSQECQTFGSKRCCHLTMCIASNLFTKYYVEKKIFERACSFTRMKSVKDLKSIMSGRVFFLEFTSVIFVSSVNPEIVSDNNRKILPVFHKLKICQILLLLFFYNQGKSHNVKFIPNAFLINNLKKSFEIVHEINTQCEIKSSYRYLTKNKFTLISCVNISFQKILC